MVAGKEHQMPRPHSTAYAWAAVVGGVALTVLLDIATGPKIWLGPLYLVCILLASWFLSWRVAMTTGIVSFLFSIQINGLSFFPYGDAELMWNMLTRVFVVMVLVALMDHVRKSHDREWRLARIDPLTGALNRQAFFEQAETPAFLSTWRLLMYADLDGLKALNDERGHAAGDASLRQVVETVLALIRTTDIVARLGGDEFVIYVCVDDEAAARDVACRLHHEINGQWIDEKTTLRCSVGALILPPGHSGIEQEIREADELMYASKRRGASLTIEMASPVKQYPPIGEIEARPLLCPS